MNQVFLGIKESLKPVLFPAIQVARKIKKFVLIKCNIHSFGKKILCDVDFTDRIGPDALSVPDSNGCVFYEPYPVRIGIIADEFLMDSYRGVADFIPITPDNYRDKCKESDFLLLVSAWRGQDNSWRFMSKEGSENNIILYELIRFYHENGKKIVFYSKEDPPNYSVFLPIAKKCDMIFTSAEEMIPRYKKDCGHDRVFVMRFGVNPTYHNPIGCRRKKLENEVIFSGSWMKKYPKRIKEQDMIFKGVLASGKKLKLIDRNFSNDSPTTWFPLRYYRYMSPAVSHDLLQKIHKLYNWAINMNSVQESPTMFANRVYELQASGNLLISNDSVGVRKEFQEEVFIVHSSNEVKNVLMSVSGEELYRRQMMSVRRVMTNENTYLRLGYLLKVVGYEVSQPERPVLVIARNITEGLRKCFEDQTYSEKTLIPESQVTEEIVSGFPMYTFWDEHCGYGKCYLEDMINAFKYTSCAYVTKNSCYSGGKLISDTEHEFTDHFNDLYATVFWTAAVPITDVLDLKAGNEPVFIPNGYSVDHFEYERHMAE